MNTHVNLVEERASDRIAFVLLEHLGFDFIVRGLEIHSRKKLIECDLVGVRRLGGGEFELECFESKLGCAGDGKFNHLVKQARDRKGSRLFRRIWGVFDRPAVLAAGIDASFGSLWIAPHGNAGHAVVRAIEAQRCDVTMGEDYERTRRYLRDFDACPALDSGPQVFLKCPACRGIEKNFHPYAMSFTAHDTSSDEHARFCPHSRERKRFAHSLTHRVDFVEQGQWRGTIGRAWSGFIG